MHLLYVDDDRINLMLFEAACRHLDGVTAATAGDADEALQCAARQRPDLLVIDLHLDATDGLRVLGTLRASGLAGIPAYLCSADDDPGLQARARDAGFAGCWAKPVEPPALQAALQALAGSPP
ncbi:MAG: response regulator [Burkholderiales bacterium]|nr:response regulator [Burkholderiales bacterium]